jgi:acyl carrier protein
MAGLSGAAVLSGEEAALVKAEPGAAVVVAAGESKAAPLQSLLGRFEGTEIVILFLKSRPDDILLSCLKECAAEGLNIKCVSSHKCCSGFVSSVLHSITYNSLVLVSIDSAKDSVSSAKQSAFSSIVAQEVLRTLAVDDVPPSASLWSHGLTSALAVQLSSNLEKSLGVTLSSTLLFDYQSMDEIISALGTDSSTPEPVQPGIPASAAQSRRQGKVTRRLSAVQSAASNKSAIKKSVERIVIDTMAISHIDPDASLWDAGLSSASAVQLSVGLDSLVPENIPATIAFDYPTVAGLTGYLLEIGGDKEFSLFESAAAVELASEYVEFQEKGVCVVHATDVSIPEDMFNSVTSSSLLVSDRIRTVPKWRWETDAGLGSADSRLNFGGFLNDIECFPAQDFGITLTEAVAMDPQQRAILMRTANLVPQLRDLNLLNDSGFFIGIAQMDYLSVCTKNEESISPFHGPGNAHSTVSGRLSYTFGASGPAVAVDTACSSSLVSLHIGRAGLDIDCQSMVTGGVNFILLPHVSTMFFMAGMLAENARCKTLDSSADGYVRSEAVGVLTASMVTTTADIGGSGSALSILSSTVNQDGRSSSLTAPSGPAQQSVISRALALSDVPGCLGNVQLHGTGTPLGDPIEISALVSVLLKDASRGRVEISAIKSSIGHTEASAGIVASCTLSIQSP